MGFMISIHIFSNRIYILTVKKFLEVMFKDFKKIGKGEIKNEQKFFDGTC